MKTTLASLLLALFLAPSSQVQAVAAATDFNSCITAPTYSGASQTVPTAFASAEPGEPSHRPGKSLTAFHSVWWKFIPPLSGIYTISTAGSTFDTVLDVYTGTAVTKLTRLGFNDDTTPGNDGSSSLTLFLTKGGTYRIAVDGYNSASVGNATLKVSLARYFTARTYQAMVGSLDNTANGGGLLSLTVANSGVLTGRVVLGPRAFPFTAAITPAGGFTASVARSGLLPVSISGTFPLQAFSIGGMPAAGNAGRVDCSLRVGDASNATYAYSTPTGDAALVPYFPVTAAYTAKTPCPRAGRYPFGTSGTLTTGNGVATLIVGATGVCTGVGRLGDGAPFTFSAPILDHLGNGYGGLGNGGAFVAHLSLYAGQGRYTMLCKFNAANLPTSLNGDGYWLRPPAPQGNPFLPLGMDTTSGVYGSRYVPPAPGTRLDSTFNGNNGAMTFNIVRQGTVSQSVTLSEKNVFTYAPPNLNQVKLAVNTTTGMVTGSVKLTGAKAATPIYGALVHNAPNPVLFYGYSVGTTGTGQLTIGPP